MKKGFREVFVLCAVVAVLPLWMGRYLPMVDLPQHAAQISIINHLNDPAYGFKSQFILDWFVPYSFGYFLAALLAKLVGIFTALRLTVTLAVLALPFSIYFLLDETGGDPWWSLIGFPIAYGFAFYWGFLSFIAAVPIGIFFVGLAFRHSRYPSLVTSVSLASLGLLLFFSHAIVFVVCGAAAGLVNLFSRRGVTILTPLVFPLPFVLWWLLSPAHQVPRIESSIYWGSYGWARALSLAHNLLSNIGSPVVAWYATGLVIAILIGAQAKRFSVRSYGPFVVAALFYFATPDFAMDISFIFQRLAAFVPVFLLIGFTPTLSLKRRILSRVLLTVMVLGWTGMLAFQFRGFNLEARDMDEIIEKLEPNKNVMGIILDNGGAFPFGQVFGHLPAYYQAEKGGGYSFTFATSYKSVARWKPDVNPLPCISGEDIAKGKPIEPAQVARFDIFFLRSVKNPTANMQASVGEKFALIMNRGPWWIYGKQNEVTR